MCPGGTKYREEGGSASEGCGVRSRVPFLCFSCLSREEICWKAGPRPLLCGPALPHMYLLTTAEWQTTQALSLGQFSGAGRVLVEVPHGGGCLGSQWLRSSCSGSLCHPLSSLCYTPEDKRTLPSVLARVCRHQRENHEPHQVPFLELSQGRSWSHGPSFPPTPWSHDLAGGCPATYPASCPSHSLPHGCLVAHYINPTRYTCVYLCTSSPPTSLLCWPWATRWILYLPFLSWVLLIFL